MKCEICKEKKYTMEKVGGFEKDRLGRSWRFTHTTCLCVNLEAARKAIPIFSKLIPCTLDEKSLELFRRMISAKPKLKLFWSVKDVAGLLGNLLVAENILHTSELQVLADALGTETGTRSSLATDSSSTLVLLVNSVGEIAFKTEILVEAVTKWIHSGANVFIVSSESKIPERYCALSKIYEEVKNV